MSDEPKPPTSLFAALLVGGIPLFIGGATMYFTSGVVLRCEGAAPGQVTCTESRRVFRLVDVPLRRHAGVRAAEQTRTTGYDPEGGAYEELSTVLVTARGTEGLLPAGEDARIERLSEQVDAFARNPVPAGLSLASQTGGMLFFVHLFGAFFVYAGLSNLWNYVRHVLGGRAAAAGRRTTP